MITKIEGLDTLKDLYALNLSDNLIMKISGLGGMTGLNTIQLKRNRIGRNGVEDVIGLLECPTLSVIDLSDNHIDDPNILPEVLVKMPNLAVLYMQGNDVCKKI